MIIDTVNQSDVPVGRVPRAEVFQKRLNSAFRMYLSSTLWGIFCFRDSR
jgi:hypothetical protein